MKPEMILLVDENDIAIGKIEREKKKAPQIHRVSALWLKNNQGEILLAKRHKNKATNPGLWGPATAGTVEAHETYEQNIYKECSEEIGLVDIQLKKSLKYPRLDSSSPHFIQWYEGIINWEISMFTLQETEVEEVRWWNHQELEKALLETPEIFLKNLSKYYELFRT